MYSMSFNIINLENNELIKKNNNKHCFPNKDLYSEENLESKLNHIFRKNKNNNVKRLNKLQSRLKNGY